MKKLSVYLTMLITLGFMACDKDDDDTVTPSGGGAQNPSVSSLPESYIIIENDTFYVSTSQQNFDQNAFRYQFNLSTKDQLDQTGNDGQTEASIGMVMTFKEKPLTSGQAPSSMSRFQQMGSDSVNFYFSYFFNTGNPNEGLNFLSGTGATLTYEIVDGKFSMTVPSMPLIDEGGTASNLSLNGGYVEASGW